RAEHPIGDRPQVGPVGLELLRHPFVLVRRHIHVAFSHSSDERNRRDVARRSNSGEVTRTKRGRGVLILVTGARARSGDWLSGACRTPVATYESSARAAMRHRTESSS